MSRVIGNGGGHMEGSLRSLQAGSLESANRLRQDHGVWPTPVSKVCEARLLLVPSGEP